MILAQDLLIVLSAPRARSIQLLEQHCAPFVREERIRQVWECLLFQTAQPVQPGPTNQVQECKTPRIAPFVAKESFQV